MPKVTQFYLLEIQTSIGKIEDYMRDLDYERFVANGLYSDAIVMQLFVIGEAVKHIPRVLLINYQEIPWTEIAGLRDIIGHNYWGLHMATIWRTCNEDLEPLAQAITRILADLEKENP